MTDEARAFYDRGLRFYADKDYPAAIAEFHAGYTVEPRREFLFAEAQAKRLSGDCAGAVGLYQKFLETHPSPAQVNATQMGLARCAQQMAAARAAPVVPPPPQAQPPEATAQSGPPGSPTTATTRPSVTPRSEPPAPPSPRVAPWYRDTPGAVLLGAGGLCLGIAGGFLAASYSARGSGVTYAQYDHQWQTAEGRWNVAMVGLIAGGLLTGAAITRYALVRRRARVGFDVSAGIAPTSPAAAPTAGVLIVGGRF